MLYFQQNSQARIQVQINFMTALCEASILLHQAFHPVFFWEFLMVLFSSEKK